jgi:hypothetical protein
MNHLGGILLLLSLEEVATKGTVSLATSLVCALEEDHLGIIEIDMFLV